MQTIIRAQKYTLTPADEALLEEKLVAPLRLLGERRKGSLLEIDVEQAPPEGRSARPCRLAANLIVGGKVFHAEAVKPSPESAADRVRSELEAEIRRARGRAHVAWHRGSQALKRMLHLNRPHE